MAGRGGRKSRTPAGRGRLKAASAGALLLAPLVIVGERAHRDQEPEQLPARAGRDLAQRRGCASDSDRDVYATCDPDGTDNGAQNTAESDNGNDATADALGQILVSFRVPVGTTPPDTFSSVAQEVVFSRSAALTARMNSQFPPLASATWVGYISTTKLFDLDDASGREVNLRPEFTLPSQGNARRSPGRSRGGWSPASARSRTRARPERWSAARYSTSSAPIRRRRAWPTAC